MASAGVEPGTLLGGTYRIVRRIGSGGMGEVDEAAHQRLAPRYAVKFLTGLRDHPEALPRFMREAQVTSLLAPSGDRGRRRLQHAAGRIGVPGDGVPGW